MVEKLKQLMFAPLLRYGISHKLQATALWSALESFSSPFFTLLLIPVFTHNLGLENYGLYVMLMAFVSFFSFTGLGMNTSITYYLAVNYETSNPQNIAQRLGSALFLTLLGTLVFVCVFLLTFQVLKPLLQTYRPEFIIQRNLIYLALMLVVITQLDLVVSASLKGLQQFKTSSKLEFSLRLLSFTAIAVVAFTQKNVFSVALVTSIMSVFTLIFRYKILSELVQFHFFEIKLNKQNFLELFQFGKWMTLQNIAVSCFGSIDKLVIGSVLGSKELGIYNVLSSLTQLIHFIPANTLNFMMPKIARIKGKISISTLKKIFLLISITSFFLSCLFMFAKNLLFTTFHIYSDYNTLYYSLIFCYFLLSLNIPSYFAGLGMNLIKAVSLQCVLGSILGVSSLLLFIFSYGILAAVASKFIYSLVAIFLIIPVIRKIKSSNVDKLSV